MFRAWEIQLHQIGSAFENSDVPLSFRGDLSYIKKAFTAAEHALIFGEGKTADSALRGAEKTSVKLGPFTIDTDIGGALGRYALSPAQAQPEGGAQTAHIPSRQSHSTLSGEDRGLQLLRMLDFGRQLSPDGQVLPVRQRFTFAIDDGQMYIGTSGHVESTTVPLGKLRLMNKKFSFDTFSKHNMYAGSSKALRFAGELTIVNLRDPDSTSVGTWSEADEYLMIVDNNSGSFAPLLPSAGLDVCLHCNLPDVPGRFHLGECSNGRLGLLLRL